MLQRFRPRCCQGKSNGTSVITARTHNAVITVFTVRVVPAESSALSIDKLSVSINPGEKEQLENWWQGKLTDGVGFKSIRYLVVDDPKKQ